MNPEDFKRFVEFPNECIAVTENASGETISAMAQNGMVEVLSKSLKYAVVRHYKSASG